MRSISWKLVANVGVFLAAIIYILPSIKPMWPHTKINLGLDLRGGMHLILEVESEKAVEGTVERLGQELKSLLKKEQIRYKQIERINNNQLRVTLGATDTIKPFEAVLSKDFPLLRERSRTTQGEEPSFIYDLPDKEAQHIKTMATEQALETIRNRIDQFGVSEPDIRRQGENRLLIQLPGITDTNRAKDLIGKTALLEFKLVDETADTVAAAKGQIPPGSELLYQEEVNRETGRSVSTPIVLKKRTLLTGAYITDAKVQIDSQYNEPYVTIDFDKKGADLFAEITGANVQKRLAIILDNKVHTAPTIQERIGGGTARITGRFTSEEAHDLAIILRAGALPAPVKILEERTVGPSLGADSIHKGLVSGILGIVIVMIITAIYYKVGGVIADLALILNMVLIAGGLAAFHATLTLPGIAGIILTIGMAVDANVLIYERIREELLLGKTPMAAVDAGFDRASLTILDSNATTLIAALVLFQFGTGPVKGFAVTLSLGVIASVFTALIFCRYLFDLYLLKMKPRTLSI
ncbi:MAG: protein translocase subunit SecD [Pseudomonadota bacterium]